jgi:hypothetical protein
MLIRKAGRVISRRNLERLRMIRDALQQILENAQTSFDDDPPVSKAYIVKRTSDGQRLVGLISSNPYRDKDDEFVAEKALRDFVDSEWRGGEYIGKSVVLFWHDGEPIADTIWADIESGFLIEIAKERDTPYARAVFDMIERLDIEWGVSIGFKAKRLDKALGVFKTIRREESSILPLMFAANPYTYAEVKMSKLRSNFLKRNAPEADKLEGKLRAGAKNVAADLEKDGVERKQKTKPVPPQPPADDNDEDQDATLELEPFVKMDTEALVDDLESMITELLGEATPEDLRDRLIALISASAEEVVDEEMSEDDETDDDSDVRAKQVELLDQLVEDLAVLDDLDTRLKSLEVLTQLPAALTKVDKRIAALERRMKGGPRAASTADESQIEDDDELAEQHKEQDADDQLSQLMPSLFNGKGNK